MYIVSELDAREQLEETKKKHSSPPSFRHPTATLRINKEYKKLKYVAISRRACVRYLYDYATMYNQMNNP